MGKPNDVNEASFEAEVIKAANPTLVDFWATWCGPCRMIAPVVEALAEEYAGKMNFAKVNVDAEPKLANKYGIRSIPTLLIFKGGKPVKQLVGNQPKEELKKALDAALQP
ncbi:MAG: thioredoxin [Dehalococcoidia bacterium]|nr:thioredoxin [Dehalococcoidia bacterium]